MDSITGSARNSLIAGCVAAAVLLVLWLATAGADGPSLFAFLVRLVHVLSAMVWIGLIVFVNFVQLVVLQSATDEQRSFLHTAVVPRVAWWFRHASTVTVGSGVVLIVTAGYLLPTLMYGTGVYVPPARNLLLWAGVLGALVMWMLVHMYIWPNMQVVLGLRPGDAAAKVRARVRVVTCARLNLVIAVPVTFAMVAAAHLY